MTTRSLWCHFEHIFSLRGGRASVAPYCPATHTGINFMNEWMNELHWKAGNDVGCSQEHFRCNMQSHCVLQCMMQYKCLNFIKICALCKVKNYWFSQAPKCRMNLFVFPDIWRSSYLYSSPFIPRSWFMCGQMLMFRFSFLFTSFQKPFYNDCLPYGWCKCN